MDLKQKLMFAELFSYIDMVMCSVTLAVTRLQCIYMFCVPLFIMFH